MQLHWGHGCFSMPQTAYRHGLVANWTWLPQVLSFHALGQVAALQFCPRNLQRQGRLLNQNAFCQYLHTCAHR